MGVVPVFLVAARRSGNTLLRLMLEGHPDLHWERGWEIVTDVIGPSGEAPSQDLVGQPEVVLTRVCELIGIPYTERLFDYAETSTYGMPDTSLAERWRGEISSRDVSLVEARTAEMQQAYGYERSELPHAPGALESAFLEIQNSVLNRTRRIKREGLLTFVFGILVNRFNMTFLEDLHNRRRGAVHEKRILELKSNYRNVTRDPPKIRVMRDTSRQEL